MDTDAAVDAATFVPPEHKQELKDFLSAFPDDAEHRMYTSKNREILLQGDVLNDAPVPAWDGENLVLAPGPAVVLSNSCDINQDKDRYATVVPVVRLDDFIADWAKYRGSQEGLAEHIENVRGNKATQLFFLPGRKGIPDSVALLVRAASIPIEMLRPNGKVFELSQLGHYLFMTKLAWHLCRPEAQDAARA